MKRSDVIELEYFGEQFLGIRVTVFGFDVI